MEIRITFPGGKRVEAQLGTYVIKTDQSSAHGGDGSAPEPYDLFLASLGTCAGAYVLGFCQARGIPTAEITITQRNVFDDAAKKLQRVALEISLPATFPEKYRASLIRAVEGCKVKRALASPPEISVMTKEVEDGRRDAPRPSSPPSAPPVRHLTSSATSAGDSDDGDVCDEPS